MSYPAKTASLRSEGLYFRNEDSVLSRPVIIAVLAVLVLGGFWLRSTGLSAESLGEDEFKKLMTVEEYRADGLSGANGEHPFLLKGLLTLGVAAADKWNNSSFAANDPAKQIPVETALRLPVTIVGSLAAVIVFLLAAELFGAEVGLVAAALWAFDPSGIGFSRIAKEDVLMVFFFTIACWCWVRSQRIAEEGGDKWLRWVWAAGVAFAAFMASKYMPHFLAILAGYYFIFQNIPETKWRLGRPKWLLFFVVMGCAFLVFNPTILLPDTWRAMLAFLSENRVGYQEASSYEYLGQLYGNKVTLWLAGIPWHFYYVFILVKTPLTTLAGLAAGIPLMFRKRTGDGQWLVFFWCFFWFMPFTVLGGKFTRYYATALPVVEIIAAVGIVWLMKKATELIAANSRSVRMIAYAAVLVIIAAVPATESIKAAPYYRLYVNLLGGGHEKAGTYFPHDEFFDDRLGETMGYIAQNGPAGVRIFNETPKLVTYYAERAGRNDIQSIWLSDPVNLALMRPGDYVIAPRGRRYLTNDAILNALVNTSTPEKQIFVQDIPAVAIYKLDQAAIDAINSAP
ncbi:MAG: phospholipid carrier-dependent glycosyltransferase [Acidobacteria bacterium]|nr:phospholipid carrier-dependent glycosyltransferase [Acidobacteriota bacterium]